MPQPLTIYNCPTQLTKSQDSAFWDEVQRIFKPFEETVFAKELKAVFKNLHDDELLETLEKTRWTGRRGFPVVIMWRTLVASFVLNIGTIQGLIRRLNENPFLALCCGIYSREKIPSRFAYYRFIKKLLAYRKLIDRCMAKTVKALQNRLPDFGESIAVDSTDIHTYSNPSSRNKRYADLDATWSKKRDKHGRDKWWFGYKAHVACDAKYQVPITLELTTAKTNDSTMLIPLLTKLNNDNPWLRFNYLLADAGYDAKENYRAVVKDFGAVPIIKLVVRKKGIHEDACDAYGTPYCDSYLPMIFWGYEKKSRTLKYRCPLACGKKGCSWLEKCSNSPYGRVRKIRLKEDYRRFCRVPRHTKKWGILYNKRGAIERVFSGLKGSNKLNNLHIRGIDKVSLHCQLSIIVMQAQLCSRLLNNK